MKTLLCLVGVTVAVVASSPERLAAQETAGEASNLPSEIEATMAEYVSRRNLALIEFDRVYLEKFEALESQYREQNQEEAAKVVRHKIAQLKKEIERLRKAPAGGFVLLEARYGSEERNLDLLDSLLGEVRENGLRISVNPPTLGVKDPHYGVRKTLMVKYLWKDRILTATAKDGRFLALPPKDAE